MMVNKHLNWRFRLSGDWSKSGSSKSAVRRSGRDSTQYPSIRCEGGSGFSTSSLNMYVKSVNLRTASTSMFTVYEIMRGNLFQ